MIALDVLNVRTSCATATTRYVCGPSAVSIAKSLPGSSPSVDCARAVTIALRPSASAAYASSALPSTNCIDDTSAYTAGSMPNTASGDPSFELDAARRVATVSTSGRALSCPARFSSAPKTLLYTATLWGTTSTSLANVSRVRSPAMPIMALTSAAIMTMVATPIINVLAVMAARPGWRATFPRARSPSRANHSVISGPNKRAAGSTNPGAAMTMPARNSSAPPTAPVLPLSNRAIASTTHAPPAITLQRAARRIPTAGTGRSASSGDILPAVRAGQ